MTPISDAVTLLFLPATRPERLAKARASGAGGVILDLEDAVAPDDKATARAQLASIADPKDLVIRVNAAGTPWHLADLAAAKALGVAAVMVPKAEPGPDLVAAIAALGGVPVIALVETALGIAGAREVARTAGVTRLAFGSLDYAADLDCAHQREILLPARSELVLASRLAGLPAPLDGVTLDTKDDAICRADAGHARDLGMGGKLLIHPAQVGPVLAMFSPSAKDLEHARQVMALPEGVATLDGKMVDAPVRLRAARLLARARQS